MAKKEELVMICPKCKSPDIDIDKTNPLQPSMGLPAMYVCNRCGHSGYTFPQIPVSKLEKFEKAAKKAGLTRPSKDKTPKVDVQYGNYMVKVWWKFVSPIIILTGILLLPAQPLSGAILAIGGMVMFYITFFKKRRIS